MKHVLLLSFLSMGILSVNSHSGHVKNNFIETGYLSFGSTNTGTQPDPGPEKMLAVEFKNQEFCRAELKDFEFEGVKYSVVSATVYFSGANFRNVETGYITSSSLKPIKNLMARCAPGSMVVFENIKVMGPDKLVRPIAGVSYLLK